MKKKRTPDRSDLDAIREQLLEFACSKHDFEREVDQFLPPGDWYGVFIVRFRDQPGEERLHCEAPLGEHFIRFRMDLEIDDGVWQQEYETILRVASGYDVAVHASPGAAGEGKRVCHLRARAWIPGFGQRIFGLTLSNLLDCKRSVSALLADR